MSCLSKGSFVLLPRQQHSSINTRKNEIGTLMMSRDIERSKMLEKGDVGGGRQGGTEGEDGGHGIPHKTKDLSLKEGQKIRISIGGTGSKVTVDTYRRCTVLMSAIVIPALEHSLLRYV